MKLNFPGNWPGWYADRPTARLTVLFTGLNLVMILLFTLIFSPFRVGVRALPFSDPWATLCRTGLALAVFGVVAWLFRPGARTRRESLWAGISVIPVLAVYAGNYPLLLLVSLLPALLRPWFTWRRTLMITVLSSLLVSIVDVALNQLVNGAQWSELAREMRVLPLWFALTLLVSLYTLSVLEFAYREAQLRQQVLALTDLQVEYASLSERARISRELHDTLGHHLMVQRLNLQVARRTLDPAHPGHAPLSGVEDSLRGAITELRQVVKLLRPLEGEQNLTQALRRLTLSVPRMQFRVDGQEILLPEAQRLTLYRAAQETITNAAKHAPGQPLTLSVEFTEQGVTLSAQNPAQPALTDSAGFGLVGLRERVRELGGEFQAGWQGGTFQVTLRLPT